jgi:hypothetical protein
MHWKVTLAILDADKLLIGINYRYSHNEDVYLFEIGILFGYIIIALKKKEEV